MNMTSTNIKSKTDPDEKVNQQGLSRDERTPGMVAVIGVNAGGGCCGVIPAAPPQQIPGVVQGAAPPGGYLEAPPQQGSSPTSLLYDGISYRIVGFKKLRQLLRPKHSYFEGDYAWIKDFAYYSDGNSQFCYPRIKTRTRNNPYRKSQLRSKHTARTIKKLIALRQSSNLDDFKVAIIVPTFPKEVSEWLSRQPGDRDMVWRLFKRFWNEDFLTLDDDSDGQAAYVNLHKWKTELPTSPHYHFHCFVPNYRLAECGAVQGDDGNNAYEFVKKSWYKQRGGRLVPFSDNILDLLKQRWHSRLVKFARRHSLRGAWMDDWRGIDVFVEYVSWDSDIGKAKLMNKLGYQSRHWVEDYAEYSNKHLDCELPPGWLQGYDNKARVFGWWASLKSLTQGVELEDKEKLSPVDGKPLEFKYMVSLDGLLHLSKGKLGYLEFYKGQPFAGELTKDDIEWLRSVMLPP